SHPDIWKEAGEYAEMTRDIDPKKASGYMTKAINSLEMAKIAFPIGATSVTCSAKDSNNNSVSGSFTVTVRDTTTPNIPAFQPTEGVRDETGVQVFFDVTAYDLVDGSVPASCNYQSGYKFPIGVTVLTCTADDSRGNHASKSLQITVTIQESGQ
ncbi:MAG: HYR domain-containing protein, partial [Nitrososphaerota archaeon]